jgi:peptidoglycan/xylan/chitin deacetylase (PgdA/CDA1 family)
MRTPIGTILAATVAATLAFGDIVDERDGRTDEIAALSRVSLGTPIALTNGVLCLTFDDRNFCAWERCISLFEKYGAHATFFVCGPIDARAESCMRKLSAAGHSIGLHGFRHQKATAAISRLGEDGYLREEILPQLSVCREKGLNVRSFAYPMSARTVETDAFLLRHFARLRAGWGEVDGKSWGEKTLPFPVGESASRRVVVAQCGTNPTDMPNRIAAMMPQIAASNLVLAVYAHDIEANGRSHDLHNITEENLEKVLSAAKEAGVAVVGFDELGLPASRRDGD